METNIKIYHVSYTLSAESAPRLSIKEIDAQETQKSYVFPGKRLSKDKLMKPDHITYDVPNFVNRFGFCLAGDVEALKAKLAQEANLVVSTMKDHVLALEQWAGKEPTITSK